MLGKLAFSSWKSFCSKLTFFLDKLHREKYLFIKIFHEEKKAGKFKNILAGKNFKKFSQKKIETEKKNEDMFSPMKCVHWGS